MEKKTASAIMLTLLFIGMLTLAFKIQPVKAEPRTWYVDDSGGADFTKIQDAIYAASLGDTIYVYNGTYYEHIYIYKSLTLIGENKYATIIDGSGYGLYFAWYGAVVTITATRVNFTNFTVRNAGWTEYSGIAVYLHDASFCSINDLVILNSRFGIAPLVYSKDNIISNNTITDAEYGIVNFNPWPSRNNVVVGNSISNSSEAGIYFNYPYNITVSGNTISNSGYGIHFQMGGSTNTVFNNIITNCGSGIRTDYTDENFVYKNNVTDSYMAIAIGYESSFNKIAANDASMSDFGVVIMDHSNNNTVFNNDVHDNYYGIALLWQSNNTKVYHNNFVDNVQQTLVGDAFNNVWDDDYPSGGNYWSDYAGVDANGDGIGDTPYIIDADNQDRYPLMHPWSPLPVHNVNTGLGYATIQEAINAPETLDGHTIFVEEGIYYEHITINKSLKLVGENSSKTIIDGDKIEAFLVVITANAVTLRGFTLRNNGQTGIWLYYSNRTSILDDFIIGNKGHGIYIGNSENNVILNNRIINNSHTGIRFDWSSHSLIQANGIENNGVAGIVFMGYIESSINNTIIENEIKNNPTGIELSKCSNNSIYHNNFLNNGRQAYLYDSFDVWDDGYPSSGNYWSDYVGVDVKNGIGQDLPGSDGIGDTPYVIDTENIDHYPLMNAYGAPPPPTYALTITTTVGGTTDPSPGIYSYTANSTIQVTAIPEANYLFDYWELDSLNVGAANPYSVLMDKNHTLKAVFSPTPPPLSVSISPLSASILVSQSVTFTSTVSGGYTPYTYQWYLNGAPVSGATSNTWTFTPTSSGIYYVYLKVTDAKSNTAQSETARITVATVPVGGYSFPIQVHTKTEPIIPYIALIAALTAIFTKLRPKTKRKH
jgi:parallel beta-helix repeat protein